MENPVDPRLSNDPRYAEASKIVDRELARGNTLAKLLKDKSVEFFQPQVRWDSRNIPKEYADSMLLLTSDRDKIILWLMDSITAGWEYR